MSRFAKSALVFCVSLGSVAMPFSSAWACGHGGGARVRVGSLRAAPSYVQPRIVYVPAPTTIPQQAMVAQPVNPQVQADPAGVNMVGNGAANAGQQAAPQQAPGATPFNDAQTSALNALRLGAEPQPAGQLPNNGGANVQAVNNVPANNAPTTDAATTSDPQQQALEALLGIEAAPASTFVGEWNANVASDITVRLSLNANGSFSWVAMNKGRQTAFSGNFAVQNGTLFLTRSNDNQKLEGSLTANQNGFNFRLKNSKDNGLNFVRG